MGEGGPFGGPPSDESLGGREFAADGDLQELIEEAAVVEHGGAQVFGGVLVAAGAEGYVVGRAVVFDDAGMIDGDVSGTLLEVGDGVAAGVHERCDELVGFDDGAFRVVDEAGLDGLPVGEVTVAFGGCEVANVELFYALFAGSEAGFGFAGGTVLEDGAVIFCAEALTKSGGCFAALADVDGDSDHYDQSDDNQGNDESRV